MYRIPCSILMLIALAGTSFAQFDAGQIAGYIHDASGASVPGATVTATNQGSRQLIKTTANPDGYYIFPQLSVGVYDVAVEVKGFKKLVRTGIVIDAQSKISSDFELTVGAISDQITVESSSAQVQTDSAQVGSLVDNKQIQNLTLNGRNPIYLAAMTPG